MASVPMNVPASLPVKVSGHRKLTGCMASASVPLKAPASVPVKASASVSLRASASLPVKAAAYKKLAGKRKLLGYKSSYVFIIYADSDELKSYDKMDIGLFGRSHIANICWSVIFAPGLRPDTWEYHLNPATEDFMDNAELAYVIASGCTDGDFFAEDQRPTHAVRTVFSLNELKTDALVRSGGCLLLRFGLMNILGNAEVSAQTDFTFDGTVYWNLYWTE